MDDLYENFILLKKSFDFSLFVEKVQERMSAHSFELDSCGYLADEKYWMRDARFCASNEPPLGVSSICICRLKDNKGSIIDIAMGLNIYESGDIDSKKLCGVVKILTVDREEMKVFCCLLVDVLKEQNLM